MVNLKSVFLSLIGLFVLINCGTEPTPTYQLTTSVVGNGSVNPSSGQFDEGESITITSTPDSGWVFSNWEGDWTSSQTPATITMDRDKTIIGVFERKDYPLNINILGEGTVIEMIYSQPKLTDYEYETIVELTPVPSLEWDLWEFSSWSGDINSNQEIIQIPIKGQTNVTVEFVFTGRKSRSTYTYDQNENLIEQINYDTDGIEITRFIYSYDVENNMVESRRTGSGGTFIESFKYENGNLIEEMWSIEGIEKYKFQYEYDSSNNKIIEKVFVDGSSTESISYFYKYDTSNNLIEEYYIYEELKDGLITYEYDSSDNLTRKTRYQANGDVILFETFIYDANDNLIEVRNSSNTRVISYSYDSSNNLIKELVMSGDNLSSEVTFEYDSNNNSVEEVRRACCKNNELVLMYRLVKVYDEKNNMTERINYQYN
jgi:hypothetical protein